ncbi:1-acyl-sn-glycerol-3-phosphate acyltransferase [Mesonia sp. HuA40]|uniref:lysophospholipid acyltransferase family protein n=1 Tax=Mesonia sp. HuA40 TaxID=2602761 RepID=UPI0011CC0909|nr:lysophospholipid acyltransferase family protein [Mesonia sp. HuA40]TXK72676.1 1-acyl-sn-glycerol-3-phosphate acyltransferase [Mesonia sp. HuA40]
MRIFSKLAILLWRIWFYLLVLIPIIVLLPFLLLFTASEQYYKQFFMLARWWALFILYGMGCYPEIKRLQVPQEDTSYMFVANHTSMLDIMLMLAVIKNPFVFVGKKELAKIPLFGFFYKRTCILVDRNNIKSRKLVYDSAQRRLKQGNSICIFPEGGVPDDLNLVLDSFKDGAFRLAIEHQIAVVPLVFYDNKKRFPYSFFKGKPGKLRAEILPFFSTQGLKTEEKTVLKQQVREAILNKLTADKA